MKRIISFVFVLILVFGTCVSVSAVDTNTLLEEKFYDYCAEILPDDKKPSEGDKVRIGYTLKIDGVELFFGSCKWLGAERKDVYKAIGDWRVYTGWAYYPYDLGVYVSAEDGIYTLEEAYEKGCLSDLSPIREKLGGGGYLTCVNVKNEDKYADLVLPRVLSENASDFSLYVDYYEGYEYYSPENCDTEGATPDYVVLSVNTNFVLDASVGRVFGDYVMFDYPSTNVPFEFGTAIFIPETNELYSLTTAYHKNIPGIEKVFTEGKLGRLIGDTDGDRTLTIKDATYIQKSIAEIEGYDNGGYLDFGYAGGSNLPKFISDFNRDGEESIKDATDIQKYIAGIEF